MSHILGFFMLLVDMCGISCTKSWFLHPKPLTPSLPKGHLLCNLESTLQVCIGFSLVTIITSSDCISPLPGFFALWHNCCSQINKDPKPSCKAYQFSNCSQKNFNRSELSNLRISGRRMRNIRV